MSILISELIKNNNLKLDSYTIVNEQQFEFFSRLSKEINVKKCVFILDKKYLPKIDESVVMIITTEEIYKESEKKENIGFCLTDNPRGLFFELLSQYEKTVMIKNDRTVIGKNCKISKNAVISDYNVVIGDNVFIDDFVMIRENVVIGNNVSIQAGTKIGCQDFNIYNYRNQTKQLKHNGTVLIGNNVLINCNCYIGQALYSNGTTVIKDNVMIGANVLIGHNCQINENSEICGGVQFGGWVELGKDCFVGMKTCVKNAITIGNNAYIGVGSVVIRNVQDNTKIFGNPARTIDF